VLLEEAGCRECGSPGQPEVHHIDGNPYNRARANLVRLCKPHHSAHTARHQLHKQPGWKRTRTPLPSNGDDLVMA
jgi:5-methylcytosine-specific restriction endonuclease McrA